MKKNPKKSNPLVKTPQITSTSKQWAAKTPFSHLISQIVNDITPFSTIAS
ncbi:MAG: hypothetical protein HUU56_13820 [Bdellovibrionaceae bacterium]|nr:hypothetical protein [Pseudobdellovibrionaceae bacterium]